jgi:hypothetical protein
MYDLAGIAAHSPQAYPQDEYLPGFARLRGTSHSRILCGMQMGLQNGVTYPVVMFLAQRHAPPTTPTLEFSTSIEFASGKTAAAYCEGTAQDPGNSAANDTSLGTHWDHGRVEARLSTALSSCRVRQLGRAVPSELSQAALAWAQDLNVQHRVCCARGGWRVSQRPSLRLPANCSLTAHTRT